MKSFEIYTPSRKFAGLLSVLLATRLGIQTTIVSFSLGYKVCGESKKEEYSEVNHYASGAQDLFLLEVE